MLMRLVAHYWLTEGRPLPTSDHALLVLARAHKPTWYQDRETIKAILKDIIPQLDRAREARDARFENLARLRAKGASVTRLYTIERRGAAPVVFEAPSRPKLENATKVSRVLRREAVDGWKD